MKHLEFKCKFKKLLETGKKVTTIRPKINLKKGDEVLVHCGGVIIGVAEIIDVIEKSFSELTDSDAKMDGFSSLEELKSELIKTYGKLKKVKIVKFKFKPFQKPIVPHEMYYGNLDPVTIAKESLEKLNLSKNEKEILNLVIETGSIKKAAMKLGGLKKRGLIRKIIRDCYLRLRKGVSD